MTLYGHFNNRAELVEAAVERTLAAFDIAMEAVDLTGDPREALVRLVDKTWQLTAESALLVVAAERNLPPARLLAAHQAPAQRVTNLIEGGRAQGVFRTDLPTPWLVAVFHSIVHAAANEVDAGRLDAAEAASVIAATMLTTCGATPAGGVTV